MLGNNHNKRDGFLLDREVVVTPDNRNYEHYDGGYHQREGYATGSSNNAGKAHSWRYMPNSPWTWAFLGIAVAQALVGLALEGYIFGEFQLSLAPEARGLSQSRTVPAYLSLFIFGFIYQLLLVWDALRLKNTIQIIGLCLYNIGLLVEAGVQFDQIDDAVDFLQYQFTQTDPPRSFIDEGFWHSVHPFVIAVPGVIALGTILMSIVAWMLYKEFAWSIYKQISADPKMKSMFLNYQVYIALLKFDFFFFLAFTVQFLVVVGGTTDAEFYLTIVAVPVTIIILVLAGFWTRRENLTGMIATIVVYFAGLGYFLFKLVRMYDSPPDRETQYKPARKSLTTFAVITVLLLIVTIIYACICTSNFNKELKPHIASVRPRRGGRRGTTGSGELLYDDPVQLAGPGPGPSRVTID